MSIRTLRLGLLCLLLTWIGSALGAEIRREIHFPDLPGYQTLKCDLHIHTVFSDGKVWPTVRVDEAWREGLDAIALTDHLEYLPHKEDVSTDSERPYDLSAGPAKTHNLLLIKGAEITRDTPPGHFNAVFLREIKPLETPEFLEAIKRANEQDAFVFWNHQGWKGEERGRWMDVHTTMLENKWFQGMEVCNHDSYFPSAHKWCLEKKLTMLGNSDIHPPDLRQQSKPDDHRTMTLVFAEDRTAEAIKEALQQRRTAVWFKEQIIGRKEILEPLFGECVRVAEPHLRTKNTLWVEVRNVCHADIQLRRTGGPGPEELTLPARATTLLEIKTREPDKPIELSYNATNFLIAPEAPLPVTLKIAGP